MQCTVVVVEDMDKSIEGLVGTKLDFVTLPRVGEHVMDFGTVVSVTHFPGNSESPPSVQLFVTRENPNAHRT